MTTERYQPPLFERKNSRYDIVPPLGTKCPFDILFGSYLHACMQKNVLYLWVDTIVYRTFSNYNELFTKYHLLLILFYNSYRHPTKGVMFSDSKYNVLTILISIRMRRLHFSLSYVGQVYVIKRPSYFVNNPSSQDPVRTATKVFLYLRKENNGTLK